MSTAMHAYSRFFPADYLVLELHPQLKGLGGGGVSYLTVGIHDE
jgi:hypothetical protein